MERLFVIKPLRSYFISERSRERRTANGRWQGSAKTGTGKPPQPIRMQRGRSMSPLLLFISTAKPSAFMP